MLRINGTLRSYGDVHLTADDTEDCKNQILDDSHREQLEEHGEWDLSFFLLVWHVFELMRTNKEELCPAIRVVSINPPTLDELGFPAVLVIWL